MVNLGFCNILRNGYLGRRRPKPQPKTAHVSHPETLPSNRKRKKTDQPTQVLTQIVLYYGKDLRSNFAHLGGLVPSSCAPSPPSCRDLRTCTPHGGACAEICAHSPPHVVARAEICAHQGCLCRAVAHMPLGGAELFHTSRA